MSYSYYPPSTASSYATEFVSEDAESASNSIPWSEPDDYSLSSETRTVYPNSFSHEVATRYDGDLAQNYGSHGSESTEMRWDPSTRLSYDNDTDNVSYDRLRFMYSANVGSSWNNAPENPTAAGLAWAGLSEDHNVPSVAERGRDEGYNVQVPNLNGGDLYVPLRAVDSLYSAYAGETLYLEANSPVGLTACPPIDYELSTRCDTLCEPASTKQRRSRPGPAEMAGELHQPIPRKPLPAFDRSDIYDNCTATPSTSYADVHSLKTSMNEQQQPHSIMYAGYLHSNVHTLAAVPVAESERHNEWMQSAELTGFPRQYHPPDHDQYDFNIPAIASTRRPSQQPFQFVTYPRDEPELANVSGLVEQQQALATREPSPMAHLPYPDDIDTDTLSSASWSATQGSVATAADNRNGNDPSRESDNTSDAMHRDDITGANAPPLKMIKRSTAIACFFCRKRKIACGGPQNSIPNGTCEPCAKREMVCVYPESSHRGKRPKKRDAAAVGADNGDTLGSTSSANEKKPNSLQTLKTSRKSRRQ